LEPEPPISAEPQDLVALVRSPESPRELRLFASKGLLPLGSEDRIRALLAVLLDGDSFAGVGGAVLEVTGAPTRGPTPAWLLRWS